MPKEAFFQCMYTIQPWIDIRSLELKSNLMKHGLVTTQDDEYLISSGLPSERFYNLVMTITPKAGAYGYHLLYMCIRDAKEHLGHKDAAQELRKFGVCV